jgi:hypothetical protein
MTAPQAPSARRVVLLGAALVAALLAVCFAPAFDPSRRLAFRDISQFYLPLYEYLRERVWEDGLPLWNPLWNTGTPIVGDATSALFYPPRLLFLLPVSTATLLLTYVLLHLALAALGAGYAARKSGVGPAAQVLAAVLYAGAGPILFQYSNPVFLVGAAWLPWCLVGLRECARAPTGRRIAAAAAALALAILGGDPEVAVNATLVVGLEWACCRALGVWRAWRKTPSESPSPAPRLAPLVLAVALAGLAALVQIWPTANLSALSERSRAAPPGVARLLQRTGGESAPWWQPPEPGTHAERIYLYSTPPYSIAEMLVPNVLGCDRPKMQRLSRLVSEAEQAWTLSSYVGLVAALAAVVAWLRWRPGFWGGLAVFALLTSFGGQGLGALWNLVGSSEHPLDPALGGPYWWLVTLVPGYASFRYPGKWSVLVALALAVHAAVWLDDEHKGASGRELVRFKRLAVAAGALGLVCAGLAHGATLAQWQPEILEETRETGLGNAALWGAFDLPGALAHTALASWHLVMLALVLVVWIHRRLRSGAAGHGRFVLGLALLSAVDLAFACWQGTWIVTVPRAVDAPWATKGRAELVPAQHVLQLDDWQWFDPKEVVADGAVRLTEVELGERRALSGAHNLAAGVPLINGNPSINAAVNSELWERVFPAVFEYPAEEQGRYTQAILRWLSVDRVWMRTGRETLTIEGKSHVAQSYTTTELGAGPRTVRANTHWRSSPSGDAVAMLHEAVQNVIQTGGFDFERVLVGDQPVPEPTQATPLDVPVRITAQGSQHLTAELTAPARTLVTFAVFQDGHWRAELESLDDPAAPSRTVRPWIANAIGQGVIVEPGKWRITLRYAPRWLPIGGLVSLLAWLGLGVIAFRRGT